MSITVQPVGHSQEISLYYKTVRSESYENIFVIFVIHLKDGYCKSVLASAKLLQYLISFLKAFGFVWFFFLKSPQPTFFLCAS